MYGSDRSGPVTDGPVNMGDYAHSRAVYPQYQDELGSWLSSITGIHISPKGVSIGGGVANLPTVVLKSTPKPAPLPVAPVVTANLLPTTSTVAGIPTTTLLLGGAALFAVFMMTRRGRRG
jgi:hypothetical protein